MLTAALLCCAGCAILPLEATLQCAGDASCGSADAGVPDGFTTGLDGGYGDAMTPAANARSSLCVQKPCDPNVDTSCNANVDGGDAATSDAGVEACHMVLEGQEPASMCLNAGTGTDGTSCTSSTQCAPGFECVGNGTCRHYCCDDSVCTKMTSESTTAYFCDVATETASPYLKVPVCYVQAPCMPLADSQCYAYGETCTVVEVNGSMNLIATCDIAGTGVLGDSCETEQCSAGFACIGGTGQRTCVQLCKLGTQSCSGSMSCQASQALAPFNVGYCN